MKRGSWLVLAMVSACNAAPGSKGEGPRIATLEDQVAVVGETLEVWIVATDPDGDPLRFRFDTALPLADATASIGTAVGGHGLFTLTPRVEQIGEQYVDFIVDDGTHEDRYPVRIEVRSAVGSDATPIFRRPVGSGAVVQIEDGPCVELDVEVEDQDSAELTLRMAEPVLEGSTLQVHDDGHAALWRWCPSPAQLEASPQHEVVLVADDGESQPVEKRFVYVVRHDGPGTCFDDVPVIEHQSRDFTTAADLEIEVAVTSGTIASAPVVLYTADDPGPVVDFGKLAAAPLQPVGDGTWRATIPNPATAPGAQAQLHYLVSAVGAGGCTVDHPSEGLHSVTVTAPSGAGAGTCEACSSDAQCGGPEDLCLAQPGGSACGRACIASEDCPVGFACSPQSLSSVDGASGQQCIPMSGGCHDPGTCIADAFEPNDGVGAALEAPPLSSEQHSGLTLCPGDDDWYAISLGTHASITAELAGDEHPDLDLVLTSAGGVVVSAAESPSSYELLTSPCLMPGDYLVRVYSIFEVEGTSDYTLTVATNAAGC